MVHDPVWPTSRVVGPLICNRGGVATTSRADTDIDGIYQLGANSFIAKPVQFEALVNLMRLLSQYWLRTVELPTAR